MEQRLSFQQMVLEQQDILLREKKKPKHRPYTLYKNLLKMIRDLN